MSNEYYQAGSTPAPNSPGSSATIRGQFTSIAAAFDKLPTMAGSEGEFVVVNPSGTALIASGYVFDDFVTVTGTQTVTNKTLAWANNTWPGFGTGATKNAGTAAGEVLLLAENDKLPALDGSLLTELAVAGLPVVPIARGGTGATDYAGAQAALGIDLKADANDAVLTGTPVAPTAPVLTQTTQVATTEFVYDVLAAAEAATPSDATPLMNGIAEPGTNATVSRDDHVHPVDISRAPASAATAGGTSFVPIGTISANNVQGAIQELLVETAPASAATAVGTSFTPAGTIAASNVQAAIQELDSETQLAFSAVSTAITTLDGEKVDKTSDTGAAVIPTGDTAQRPLSPVEGHFRRNAELGQWEGYDGSQWSGIGGASGGGGNPFCYENDIHVTANYSITPDKNAGSFGPITIDDGVVVTVPDGSVWTIT